MGRKINKKMGSEELKKSAKDAVGSMFSKQKREKSRFIAGNMEWTKENTDRTYIVCRSAVAYKKAIDFYEKLGYRIAHNIIRDISERKSKIFYYVIATHMFITISSYELGIVYVSKEIRPFYKPRRKFPREMMVSDDNKKWEKKLVAGKIKSTSPYVSYIKEEFQEGQAFKFLLAWKYAKEITK